jgi:hypothetical protein
MVPYDNLTQTNARQNSRFGVQNAAFPDASAVTPCRAEAQSTMYRVLCQQGKLALFT